VIHPAVDVAVTRRLPDRSALSPAGDLVVASTIPPPEEVHVPTQPRMSVIARTTCLTVTVHPEATTTTVCLAGELDVTGAPTMAQTVHHLRQDPPHDVVLDVSGVRFCDARGLAAILGVRSQLHDVGTTMTLRGCDPRMRLLLRLTGLDQLLA
jgi:anti-anti-sigma factor